MSSNDVFARTICFLCIKHNETRAQHDPNPDVGLVLFLRLTVCGSNVPRNLIIYNYKEVRKPITGCKQCMTFKKSTLQCVSCMLKLLTCKSWRLFTFVYLFQTRGSFNDIRYHINSTKV